MHRYTVDRFCWTAGPLAAANGQARCGVICEACKEAVAVIDERRPLDMRNGNRVSPAPPVGLRQRVGQTSWVTLPALPPLVAGSRVGDIGSKRDEAVHLNYLSWAYNMCLYDTTPP
ncbi:hypothetical protein Snoj_35760 [Streptomyces nojiriensis]|uniref:Uncharacterized protein n=2 Tax=Streptomyces nojiriensis TaxID=66374 RepID=A0ABQ3SNE6_9ACTN|nr:hypothetical protein [Streptomyces nojiriensis]QTI43215.1 hypothetical protein JYK04_00977 [Streptomyces nojiriensis]GGS31105.1 hypothetical protein GCM10010205_71660 [Streptomyces nojiriensis]GHI69658.1 hypothetical protein Snoj_35760 [Streptomyces nojiriensis]